MDHVMINFLPSISPHVSNADRSFPTESMHNPDPNTSVLELSVPLKFNGWNSQVLKFFAYVYINTLTSTDISEQ
jgi:hypothetical protein